MKLASLKREGHPDGALVVVSPDLSRAVEAAHIVPSLREAVERWDEVSSALQTLSDDLHQGNVESIPFDQGSVRSPLPRAWAWLDGSAFIQHVKLVRKARNAPLPEGLMTDPLMYQGGSDTFLDPTEDIPHLDPSYGLDFEGEVAVVLDRVPLGTPVEKCRDKIRLIMLCNDVSLRGLIPAELKKGFGFVTSKPSSAFSPVAVTPDELGDAWRDGRVHLNLDVAYNGQFYGNADAGQMHFSFDQLIAHVARTRELSAGTVLGSGTVSNEDTSRGSSCLAEKRMLEKIETGAFVTPFMKPGDTVRIAMKDGDGNDIFGAIDQSVVAR